MSIQRCATILTPFLLSACTQDMAPPPPPSAQLRPVEELREQASMSGDLVLNLFDDPAGGETGNEPTFTVKSPNCTHLGDSAWSFEDAQAWIYGDQGEDDVLLTAGEGRLDHASGEAMLTDGVTVQVNTIKIELQDVAWKNEDRVAQSQNNVVMTDGDTQLQATSMQLLPDENKLTLTDVTGTYVQK